MPASTRHVVIVDCDGGSIPPVMFDARRDFHQIIRCNEEQEPLPKRLGILLRLRVDSDLTAKLIQRDKVLGQAQYAQLWKYIKGKGCARRSGNNIGRKTKSSEGPVHGSTTATVTM